MVAVNVDWGRIGVSLEYATSLELDVGTGARGYSVDAEMTADADIDGEAVDGARIFGWSWRAGRWQELQQNTAGPSTPAATMVSAVGSDGTDTYCHPFSNSFHFAIRPLAGAGNGPAAPEVLVDYAVFRTRYRLPSP